MCLISVCPKGTLKTGKKVEDFIKNGERANGMGSGFAYKKNGENKIYLSKAFFKVEYLINAINDSNLTEEDELIIHHRIATSGTDAQVNTHPFIITHDFEEMTQLTVITDKPVMAHNGVFSGYNDLIDRTYNDTAHWIHLIMSNPNFLTKLKEDKESFVRDYGNALSIRYNKLAFLFPDRDLITIGDFKEDDGYFHSNNGYEDWRTRNIGGVEGNGCQYSYNGYSGNWPKANDFIRNTSKKKKEDLVELSLEEQNYITSEDCMSTLGIKKISGYSKDDNNKKKSWSMYYVDNSFLNLDEITIKFFIFKKDTNSKIYYILDESSQPKSGLVTLRKLTNKNESMILPIENLKSWKIRIAKNSFINLFLDIFQLKTIFGLDLSSKKKKKLTSWYKSSLEKKREKTVVNNDNVNLLVSTLALGFYLTELKKEDKKSTQLILVK